VSSTHIVVRRYTGVKAFFRGATLGADLFENAGFLDNKSYNNNKTTKDFTICRALTWSGGNNMSKIDELKAELESLPSDEFAEIFAGCQRRIGRDGTRKLRPTLNLGGSISWCRRLARRKLMGLLRTYKCIALLPFLGSICPPA